MVYEPQTWVNNDPATPLSAERLLHMETGIDTAHDTADQAAKQDDPMLRKSGWRSLTPATWVVNGWAATGLYVKRSGDLVEVRVYGLNGTASTAPTMTNALPTGFRFQNLSIPTGSHGPVAVVSNTPTGALSGAAVVAGTNGDSIRCEARSAITDGRFVLVGTTTEAWVPPESYPGTAV